MKQLKSDEQLGLVYLTEVSKKDILGGLDQFKDKVKESQFRQIIVYVLLDMYDVVYPDYTTEQLVSELYHELYTQIDNQNKHDKGHQSEPNSDTVLFFLEDVLEDNIFSDEALHKKIAPLWTLESTLQRVKEILQIK